MFLYQRVETLAGVRFYKISIVNETELYYIDNQGNHISKKDPSYFMELTHSHRQEKRDTELYFELESLVEKLHQKIAFRDLTMDEVKKWLERFKSPLK